ncbi:putative O-glycosylation ligase, exosortase A system-associated [Colwellia sp. 39_35_sub15_T18]|nr:putative O-glycosylation ligase, exosortase A system-associated [Colwellia sp. 39_35_sub15_T18]
MRDVLIALVFPILLFYIFKRPYIGASLWIWSAMFYPKGWVWGFANSIRFNLFIALATILAYFFQKEKAKYELSALSVLVFILSIWGTVSAVLTISNPDIVWHEWNLFIKIMIFYFVCTMTLTSKHHINTFLWAIVLSASFYGAGEGVKYIVSGGGHVLKGISGSRLSDRNELALALNMTLPILLFLFSQSKLTIVRLGLASAVLLNIVAIIGSFSRGGLLGLMVVGGYFFIKSKKKMIVMTLLTLTLITANHFAPDKWVDRMSTISEMSDDNSFLGRLTAWKQAILMAGDNPVFGAGFKAGQNPMVWKLYEPDFYTLNFLIDTGEYVSPAAKAAHSIYFQVLGDMGLVGLLIFLGTLWYSLKNLKSVIKHSEDIWMVDLAKMLQVTILAYCIGGAALSLPYFDLSFALFALSHCLRLIMLKQQRNNDMQV